MFDNKKYIIQFKKNKSKNKEIKIRFYKKYIFILITKSLISNTL